MKTADAQTTSTIKHLSSDIINNIALSLNEDVYGANGDLDTREIHERLITHIHHASDYAYAVSGLVPVSAVADLIRSVWEYEDRKHMELLAQAANAGFDYPL
jgi:hypothetical protein